MPRAGWKKPDSERRLSDLVSMGLMHRVFPDEVVDAAIVKTARKEQRNRSLPANLMVHFAIAMALHSEGSYEDVFLLMTDGLSWASDVDELPKPPTKSAIFQARERLGASPLQELFRSVAKPLATPETPGAWLAGRRLVAIDGMCLDVADTPLNSEFFGRPGVSKGEQSAFPQARVVGLVECGTHAIVNAALGAYTTSENALAGELMDSLEPGMLLLADRGFCGFPLWKRAQDTGADLLWRAKSAMKPRHVETLADGSWLAELKLSGNAGRNTEPVIIRVIEYTIDDGRENDEAYRLFTTITDANEATAVELAQTYAQRWEIELSFDELKTHQRGAGQCCVPSLRSLFFKKYGAICVATTRYARSCGKPPIMLASILTESALLPHYE